MAAAQSSGYLRNIVPGVGLTIVLPLAYVMATPGKNTATVSTKGQVILPKPVRDARRWQAGTRLLVEETADGVLLRPAPVATETRPKDVFGRLKYAGKAKTVEEMGMAVAKEARRRAGDRR
ncbi:MAG TPA: AbrB/MazE/SpoVT family DNA-binding domain-containing protein [Pseudoxanthomonas sp.]